MRDLNNKVDNAGATADGKLPSVEWNEVASELQNIIESTGQTLASGDLLQMVKSISTYCTGGDFYTGAGIANAYTGTVIAPMIAPDSLEDGMKFRLVIPITNSSASTLNIGSFGVFDIEKIGGLALVSSELIAGTEYDFTFRTSGGNHYEISNPTFRGLSLQGLDFPTIDETDNRINNTEATATNGGTVTILANTVISIAEEVLVGQTGIMQAIGTVAYTTPDLDVSSLYYIRAAFINGVFTIYEQKGANNDSIPAGLVGTPGGSSGGGFDSTVLDVLLSRVTTGTAGTLPLVINIANKANLSTIIELNEPPINPSTSFTSYDFFTSLRWGRVPLVSVARKSALTDPVTAPDDLDYRIIINSLTKYELDFELLMDWGQAGSDCVVFVTLTDEG